MRQLCGVVAAALAAGLFLCAPPASANEEMMMKKAHEGTAPVASEETIRVQKAKDGYTVAEVYAQRAGLDGKKVAVRGKVVKVSSGIMGKNWIHLQDGSGSREKNDFNLVVTSQDEPKVGDVVTASGTLAKDKNLGMGYRYVVLVEDANVRK